MPIASKVVQRRDGKTGVVARLEDRRYPTSTPEERALLVGGREATPWRLLQGADDTLNPNPNPNPNLNLNLNPNPNPNLNPNPNPKARIEDGDFSHLNIHYTGNTNSCTSSWGSIRNSCTSVVM